MISDRGAGGELYGFAAEQNQLVANPSYAAYSWGSAGIEMLYLAGATP
jgi:hypothetical protein